MREFGRYTIVRELGRGGMATVYLAHDPQLKRDVALKVLPRQFTHDPQFRARFKREAEALARLDHPAIVPVFETGEVDDQPYLVMRYMPGGTLLERMAAGLTTREITILLKRIASALDAAHARGMVHRDLKPSNILFDQDGQAYLADFGVVKLAEATAATTTSMLIGTPAYMSPEQAAGKGEVDGRSDIYALGVIVFELLAGRAPYESTTPVGQIVAHLNEPVPSVCALKPGLPAQADTLIHIALAKRPEARFQTADQLARAVDDVLAGRPADLPRVIDPSPTLVVRRTGSRWPLVAAASVGLLLVVALSAMVSAVAANTWRNGTPPPITIERVITQPAQIATVLITTTPLPTAVASPTSPAPATATTTLSPTTTRVVRATSAVGVPSLTSPPTEAPATQAPQQPPVSNPTQPPPPTARPTQTTAATARPAATATLPPATVTPLPSKTAPIATIQAPTSTWTPLPPPTATWTPVPPPTSTDTPWPTFEPTIEPACTLDPRYPQVVCP
jgi:serine/threonine-protein kinase